MEPQVPAPVKLGADDSQRPPGCLLVFTVILGLGAGLALLAALALTLLVASYRRGFMPEEVAIIASFLIPGLPGLPVAWGLWRRRNWARVLVIVFSSLVVAWNLVGLVLELGLPQDRYGERTLLMAMGIIPILLSGVIIYWFARSRRFFH